MRPRPELCALLAALLILPPVGVSALSSDAGQPVEIEANHVSLDDPRHMATYTGDVVLTQGSIEAHADRLVIHMTETDQIERIVMTGQPATFRQLTTEGAEIYGEGLRMEYRESQSQLTIEDQALLRRGLNEFRGPLIEFDLTEEVITASSPEDATERERVRITIQPGGLQTPAADGGERDRP
jgi:lipopolysaccharide export system protein LptA